MLKEKEYVAIQEFSMTLDNGKTPITVKKGDTMTFDGLNVTFKGEQGTARPLSKVIGEWIAPIGTPVKPVGKKLAAPSRNATGGKVIEHSDYTSDPLIGVKNQPDDSVEALLKSYDKTPPIKLVNGKREVTSNLDDARREVKIINDDANEVRKVTATDGAPVVNKNSVELKDNDRGKRAVLSPEGVIVKKTNYSGKTASTNETKKLTIDYEASGVEVRKTSDGAPPKVKKSNKVETFETDMEVAETSYPSVQTTDVGSSTQAQIEQRKTTKKASTKKKTAKKKAVKKTARKKGTSKKKTVKKSSHPINEVSAVDPVVSLAEDLVSDIDVDVFDSTPITERNDNSTGSTKVNGPVIESDGQEAVVISKVTRDSDRNVKTNDGITSKVTVGGNEDVDVGAATFSSSGNFDEPTVTFGSGEETAVDISAEVFDNDEADIIESSDDVDLNEILSDM